MLLAAPAATVTADVKEWPVPFEGHARDPFPDASGTICWNLRSASSRHLHSCRCASSSTANSESRVIAPTSEAGHTLAPSLRQHGLALLLYLALAVASFYPQS